MTKLHKAFTACLVGMILVSTLVAPVSAESVLDDISNWFNSVFGRAPIKPIDNSMFPDASGISSMPQNAYPVPMMFNSDASPIDAPDTDDPVPHFPPSYDGNSLRALQSKDVALLADEPVSIYQCSPGYINASGSDITVFLQHWKPNSTYRFNFTYEYEGSPVTFSLPRVMEYVYQNPEDPSDYKNGMLACVVSMPPQRLPMGTIDNCVLEGQQNHFGQITHLYHDGLHLASTDEPIIDDVSIVKTGGRTFNVSFDLYDPGSYSAVPGRTITIMVDSDRDILVWNDGVMENRSVYSSDAFAYYMIRDSEHHFDLSFKTSATYVPYLQVCDRVVIPLKWKEGAGSSASDWRYVDVEYVTPQSPNNIEILADNYEIHAGDFVNITTKLTNLYTGEVFEGYPVIITGHRPGAALGELDTESGAIEPIMLDPTVYPTTWTLQAVWDSDPVETSETIEIRVLPPRNPPNELVLTANKTHAVNNDTIRFNTTLTNTTDPSAYWLGLNVSLMLSHGTFVRPIPIQSGVPYDWLVTSDAGIYTARAVYTPQEGSPLYSEPLTIIIGDYPPDTLTLEIQPTQVHEGDIIGLTPKLSSSFDPGHLIYDVMTMVHLNVSSSTWLAKTGDTTLIKIEDIGEPPMDIDVWVTYEELTSNHVTVHVIPDTPPPVPTYFPTYPVPSQTPPGYSRNTTQTGGWLNFTLTVTQQDIQNLTAAIWGMGVITPQDFYKWMRGSAGQVNVTVSNSTLEQLQKEAEPEVNSPFKFIMDISTAVVTTEDKFVGYMLTLIRENPYAKMWPSISDWFTHLIPGFLLNLVSLLVLLFAAIQVRKLFH